MRRRQPEEHEAITRQRSETPKADTSPIYSTDAKRQYSIPHQSLRMQVSCMSNMRRLRSIGRVALTVAVAIIPAMAYRAVACLSLDGSLDHAR